mmetsp:Transcript_4036/g.9635  ORF Transcript_4036/g.9635 Transcript_4036/m.9635 type:complete len:213 (-) Transcript_4036:10909-11547(-)
MTLVLIASTGTCLPPGPPMVGGRRPALSQSDSTSSKWHRGRWLRPRTTRDGEGMGVFISVSSTGTPSPSLPLAPGLAAGGGFAPFPPFAASRAAASAAAFSASVGSLGSGITGRKARWGISAISVRSNVSTSIGLNVTLTSVDSPGASVPWAGDTVKGGSGPMSMLPSGRCSCQWKSIFALPVLAKGKEKARCWNIIVSRNATGPAGVLCRR